MLSSMTYNLPVIKNSIKNFLNNNHKIILTSPLMRNYYQSKNVNPNKKNENKNNENKIDENEFQVEKSYGIKNLEELGMIKRSMGWPQYNRVVYPPQPDGTLIRNPFVNHMRNFIKYPPEKLWYPAFLIRGMSIDEAIKQLSFHKLKGAAIIKEVLIEAQDLAIKEHNFEYKSNMWISKSFSSKSITVKGVRKHRGPRIGVCEYKYSHYFVRLEEGAPPRNTLFDSETYEARAKRYIENLRKRSIYYSI